MGKYIAFISYRHTDRDQKLSLLLRKKLEGWHLPKGCSLPGKRKVFRDTDELPTSANLGDDIESALEDSEWLIALCSEEYTESLWCRREIEKYIGMGRKDRILPVLVSGSPETSFPEEIRDLAPVADLREKTGPGIRSAADACTAGLLARMAGKEPEMLLASEHRSRMAFRGCVAAAACAVLLGLTFYAARTAEITEKKNQEIAAATRETEAAREKAVAELNRAYLANGHYLAEQAWQAIGEGDNTEAIRLALSALPEDLHGDLPVSVDALAALRVAVNMPAHIQPGTYHFTDRIDTDFRIAGYIAGYDEGSLILLVEDYYAKQKYLQLSDRSITDITGTSRTKAAEHGYSYGYAMRESPTFSYVYYGPELPLACDTGSSKDISRNIVTLDGEPFYADHVTETGNLGWILAWTENPQEGKRSGTALIELDKKEATEIRISGFPVSVDFSDDDNQYKSIAIVDAEGSIILYDRKTGDTDRIPGKWSRAVYPKSSETLCAVDVNGEAFLIDTASHNITATLVSPSPILDLQYCSIAGLFLARCTDGARIYSGDGKLKSEYITGETPLHVLWDGYDNQEWDHSGKKFLLLYDRRVDVYEADTNTDPELSDILLDITKDSSVIYSPDGAYIYVTFGSAISKDVSKEYVEATINRALHKLDAKTGEEIWRNVCMADGITRDGKALWRLTAYGLMKIDAETGDCLWEGNWFTGGSYDTFRECPDESREMAVIVNSSNGMVEEHGDLYAVDMRNGDLLWSMKDMGMAWWNRDGTRICCIRRDNNKDTKTLSLRYTVLDPADGTVLEEKCLKEEFEYNYRYRRIQVSTERDRILLSETSRRGEPSHTKIEMFSLPDGEQIQTWELDEVCDPIFSFTGETAARWTAWEDDTDYCCVLAEEGGTGPVIPVDSERGRRLCTTLKKDNMYESIHPLNAYEYVLFNGEDAGRKDYISEHTDPTTIVRLSDGAVLMNMAFSKDDQSADVTVSPDGTSMCITGFKGSRIIRLSDAETLVQKARKRLAKEEDGE